VPAYICRECVELCASIFEGRKFFEDDEELERIAQRLKPKLEEYLSILTSLEYDVIQLRNGLLDGITYSPDEIAEKLGLAPDRAAEIEARANAKLRESGPQVHG
jgi:DNA-directed RNA polymerase sigma subunit (sigma70/sigma32)